MKRKRPPTEKETPEFPPESPLPHSSSIDTTSNRVYCTSDKGHRFGNFHSYYNFNPPVQRVSLLQRKGRILDYIVDAFKCKDESDTPITNKEAVTFTYADYGCNEGDLTIELCKALLERWNNKGEDAAVTTAKIQIAAKGFDIDPVLIERAESKWKGEEYAEKGIQASFKVANLLMSTEESDETDECNADLTSLFSTTMWIHIHGGDEGLRRVLKNLCKQTRRFLLVEPQPSKCYLNAKMRLRKLGQPDDLDVSCERLTLRANIEDEINKIVTAESFRRVEFDDSADEKTKWKRSLQLYERVQV